MPTIKPAAAPEPQYEEEADLSRYVGRSLVFLPLEIDVVNTKFDPNTDILRADVWAYDADEKRLEELGTVGIFWTHIIAQLRPHVGSGNAVSGKLVMVKKAYELEDLDEKKQALVDEAWDSLESF